MSTSREGGCASGEIGFHLRSDPLYVHCCRCSNCQGQTGSAFVMTGVFAIEADRVKLLEGGGAE